MRAQKKNIFFEFLIKIHNFGQSNTLKMFFELR
jgi:hypothetical protein